MSEYTNLKPIYGSSIMFITPDIANLKIYFKNIIIYDYFDVYDGYENYMEYLEDPIKFQQEIDMYWKNMQYFLDHEVNKVNEKDVALHVSNTNIMFRKDNLPYVQYTVEFQGDLETGLNVYENHISEDVLDYPIHSQYILNTPLKIIKVQSNLDYEITDSNQIVEYYGEKGDSLSNYEAIFFLWEENTN